MAPPSAGSLTSSVKYAATRSSLREALADPRGRRARCGHLGDPEEASTCASPDARGAARATSHSSCSSTTRRLPRCPATPWIVLEPVVVRLLASRRHRRAAATKLRELIAVQRVLDDIVEFGRANAAFHRGIITLAGNQTLFIMADVLNEIVQRAIAAFGESAGAPLGIGAANAAFDHRRSWSTWTSRGGCGRRSGAALATPSRASGEALPRRTRNEDRRTARPRRFRSSATSSRSSVRRRLGAVESPRGDGIQESDRGWASSCLSVFDLRRSASAIDDQYYVRQLRDWKASVDLDEMRPESMNIYGRLCGWTLARAHARSGDRHANRRHTSASRRRSRTLSASSLTRTPARTSATMPRSPKRSRMGASPHDAGCSPAARRRSTALRSAGEGHGEVGEAGGEERPVRAPLVGDDLRIAGGSSARRRAARTFLTLRRLRLEPTSVRRRHRRRQGARRRRSAGSATTGSRSGQPKRASSGGLRASRWRARGRRLPRTALTPGRARVTSLFQAVAVALRCVRVRCAPARRRATRPRPPAGKLAEALDRRCGQPWTDRSSTAGEAKIVLDAGPHEAATLTLADNRLSYRPGANPFRDDARDERRHRR